MKRILTILLLAALTAGGAAAKDYIVSSPDRKTDITVTVDDGIRWSVRHAGQEVLAPSALSMTVNGKDICADTGVKSAKTDKVKGTVTAPFWRQAEIHESYNQLTLNLKNGWSILFRAYDGEGVAYRFCATTLKKGDCVTAELAEFNFSRDFTAYVPYVGTNGSIAGNLYASSFESQYTVTPLSAVRTDELAFSPLLVCLDKGLRVEITDADIESYPGMFLTKGPGTSLQGTFAPVPAKVRETPTRGQVVVDAFTDHLADIRENASKKAPRCFPWRVLAIAENDADLPVNNLVYLLASPSRLSDISWIKPGKVAWDWWNDWNITGVDFKAGINTQTYKYYIDFAAANGIEYVVLDEGWSAPLDILKINPDIDLKELCRYAAEKHVDLVLWAVSYVLDKDLEKACKTYAKMGVKGFKVDFMNRDDQPVTEQLYRIAEAAARHHMLIDYHGMYKPAGMNRTWPNVLNFEGVWGLEQMKWTKDDIVEYDVTFPYIRMLSGPVDYTPGAMRNASRSTYAPNYSNPVSQGTRSRQVAEYVVFDAPFEMLCDNPTAYMKEQETTDFITAIPTVWDETRVLQGEIGQYIVTARRSGNRWYIGGLTNWDARDLAIDLGALDLAKGEHSATLYRDGVNVTRNATDYKIETLKVQTKKPLTVHLASGGGFVLVIE
ncbi:MAG: glycoside hydrolase family 97 protein [Bacteroidales bacterium]|nr:glycoside hydrolase family 97 protein [Bacteroidales bacterium]